jgi:cyclic-di-AMP phosphodiesterase PgpH
MPGASTFQRLRAMGIRVNQRLSVQRSFGEIKRITLISFGITLLTSVVLLTLPLMQELPRFKLGEIVQADFKAYMDLRIADEEETARLKKAAFDGERPAFDRDNAAQEKLIREIDTEFSWIARTLRETMTLPGADRLALLQERMPYLTESIYSKSDVRGLLRERKLDALQVRAVETTRQTITESGFLKDDLDKSVVVELLEKGAQVRTINTATDVPDLIWNSEQLQTPGSPKLVVRAKQLKDKSLSPGTMRIILTRIQQLQRNYPSLSYNGQYTDLRRQRAADRVTPVYSYISRGTTLLRAGDTIDKDSLKLVEQVHDNHRRRNGAQLLGIFLIMGVLAVAISYFSFRFAHEQMRDYASHVILHILFLFMFGVELLVRLINPLKAYDVNFALFVPFGFFGILTGQFFGARITLSAGIYLAIFSYILTGFDNQSLLLALTTVIAGLYASTRMERRTQLFKGGLIIAVTNVILISGFELIAPAARNYELKIAAVLTNSVVSVLITLGLLPLFELIFNLPTPFRLLELNDFNHPLLTRMAAIAPSTHSHSVMLANLSEAAVRALHGDTLLTRVGCLFHDIGKMVHPDFYAENRHLYPTSESFKKLGPLKSAQMIIKHVTDGIDMGRQHRLPEKVISFIPEHHGTTTIQFFYHRALEGQTGKQATHQISRKQFQYPGPRPQTRETAVAMIADSVEAASRTAVTATPEEFASIIDRIIQNKISEEQFNEAPLSLGELAIIRKAFLDVLVSTYHQRPKYPTMQETQALEVSVQTKPKKRTVTKKKRVKKKGKQSGLPELID